MKQVSHPPFLGIVDDKKWCPFFNSGIRRPIFLHIATKLHISSFLAPMVLIRDVPFYFYSFFEHYSKRVCPVSPLLSFEHVVDFLSTDWGALCSCTVLRFSKRKIDNFQHCLLLALLSCLHSSGKNKNDKDFQNSQSTVQKVKVKVNLD